LVQAFPASPEKRQTLKLYQMSKEQLEDTMKKQLSLLKNKALIANLSDKGAKIEKRIVEIKEQLAKYHREGAGDDVESMTAILAGLKIVEKRPSAAFFKKRELIEEKEIGTKKEKFHTHRTKEYNEKAKENQPIKTLSIDEERRACEQTLNRIDEAEKARQLASLKSRLKIPIILESEPKWRDQANDDDNDENDEGNLVDSDDEAPVETGLEIQQNM